MAEKLGIMQSSYSNIERDDDPEHFELKMKLPKYRRTENIDYIRDAEAPIGKLAAFLTSQDNPKYRNLSIKNLARLLHVHIDWGDELPNYDDAETFKTIRYTTKHAISQRIGANLVEIAHPSRLRFILQGLWSSAELEPLGTIHLPSNIEFTEDVISTVLPDSQFETWGSQPLKQGEILFLTRFRGQLQEGKLYIVNRRGEPFIRVASKIGEDWHFISPHWNKRQNPDFTQRKTTFPVATATPYSDVVKLLLEANGQRIAWP